MLCVHACDTGLSLYHAESPYGTLAHWELELSSRRHRLGRVPQHVTRHLAAAVLQVDPPCNNQDNIVLL